MLPRKTCFDFRAVVFCESTIERPGVIEFNIDAGFFTELGREGWIKISTPATELKESIVSICFRLRSKHACRGERRFPAKLSALQQQHAANLLKRERAGH